MQACKMYVCRYAGAYVIIVSQEPERHVHKKMVLDCSNL